MKTSQPNDQEIWGAFKAGDHEAFALIFDQHYRQLYSYGKQFLDDESLTDDAIQELFANLWRTRENLNEEVDNIKFYLFRSLRRNIKRLSAREKRFQSQDLEQAADQFAHHFVTPVSVDGHEESLLTQRLKKIIDQLPNRQREAVMLRYYQNFKTEEIAVIMGISLKTVKNTLFNAMTTLRSQSDLLKACLTLAAILLALLR